MANEQQWQEGFAEIIESLNWIVEACAPTSMSDQTSNFISGHAVTARSRLQEVEDELRAMLASAVQQPQQAASVPTAAEVFAAFDELSAAEECYTWTGGYKDKTAAGRERRRAAAVRVSDLRAMLAASTEPKRQAPSVPAIDRSACIKCGASNGADAAVCEKCGGTWLSSVPVTARREHAPACVSDDPLQAWADGWNAGASAVNSAKTKQAASVPNLSLVESFKAQLIESVSPIFWPHIEAASTVIIERMKAAAPQQAARVPVNELAIEISEVLADAGWRNSADAQWSGLRNAIPKLRALLAAAPEAPKP